MIIIDEIAKFDALAKDWWNPAGPMKPLHLLNPLRLQYIKNQTDLFQQQVLDIGCGGGLLSEAMAKCQATVTGIDLSESLLTVAKQHADTQGLTIDYQLINSGEFAEQNPARYDVITCMELIEHVPDPDKIIQDCARLIKPGGIVFFATINRNIQSFFKAIIGAEYVLGLLPKGTHQYANFIKPSEMTLWASQVGLTLKGLQGIIYKPFIQKFDYSDDVSVNYMAYFQKI